MAHPDVIEPQHEDLIKIDPAPDIEPITKEHLSFMVKPISSEPVVIHDKPILENLPIINSPKNEQESDKDSTPIVEEKIQVIFDEDEKIQHDLTQVEKEIKEIEEKIQNKEKKEVLLHLRDSLSESDLIDSYVNTERKKTKKEYVPVTRYDSSDWINFIFEMKERLTQFISYLPSNHQTKFTKVIESFVVPKKKNMDNVIILCASYGLNLSIIALNVLYLLASFILKAQSPMNSFFIASEEFIQFLEDLTNYCKIAIKNLNETLNNLSKITDFEKIEKRTLWVTILRSIDETEEKIENLHQAYFFFFRNTLKTMLEKVDSEIFWVQKGVLRDNQPVIQRVMEIWKKYIKPFVDKEENLNDPDSLRIPLGMKQIWREIIHFEKSFSLLRKKRF